MAGIEQRHALGRGCRRDCNGLIERQIDNCRDNMLLIDEEPERSGGILAFVERTVHQRESGADCASDRLCTIDRKLGGRKRRAMLDRIKPGIAFRVDIERIIRPIEISDTNLSPLLRAGELPEGPEQDNDGENDPIYRR